MKIRFIPAEFIMVLNNEAVTRGYNRALTNAGAKALFKAGNNLAVKYAIPHEHAGGKRVEEHVGTIQAANRTAGGAMISIRLPVDEAAREMMIAAAPGRADRRREQA